MNSADDNTVQELINEGQGLVHSLAARIHRSVPVRVEMDDLIAYGEIGLAEAARDFDPTQRVAFTTFAYYRVRGAIYDGLSKMSWISRARYKRLRYEQMSTEVLAAEPGRQASDNATVEGEGKWFRNVTSKLAVVYLTGQDDQASGVRDSTIEDPQASAAPAIVAQREIVERLRDLVQSLPRVEQTLIQAVYFEGATLLEAANSLGISKSWASRLHAKALEQLGRALRRLGASD